MRHDERVTTPRAVLFDLFNTLVPGGSRAERDAVSHAMAADLGVDPQAFVELYAATFDDRVRGRLGDLGETIRSLARRLGAEPTAYDVAAAAQRRLDFTLSLHAGTWALPALRELRAEGYRIGLVTDCTAETPAIWPDSPLATYVETTSFSCVTGLRKPAAGAYRVAMTGLRVTPAECVYVGDGGSRELTGAEALRMRAIRFRPSGEDLGGVDDPDLDWAGQEIDDLAELPGLLLTPDPATDSA